MEQNPTNMPSSTRKKSKTGIYHVMQGKESKPVPVISELTCLIIRIAMVMKRFVLFALLFLAVGTGWTQDFTTDHLFRVFYYDKDNNRIDIPENEHVSTKITGMFLVHKDKMVLLGESAKSLLSDTDKLFIEVLDTTQLKPQFFRVIKLKVKKGNREATCWSNSPLGAVDSSKDFIPMVLYPVKDNVYHIDIKDLQKGHYLVMYQEGLNQLMEIYDFDK